MRYYLCASMMTLSLSGCVGDGADIEDVLVPSRVAGFLCTTAPSEAYSPGFVYRVDQQGAELLVDDLSGQAEIFAYTAALGTYSASVSRGAGLKLQLLEVGSAEASGSGSRSARVSFSDGRFVLMRESGLDAIMELANEELVARPGSDYFVVRDTVQAKGIDIQLTSQSEATLGGEASINEMLSASPNANISRDQDLSISGTFDTPLNVCIRAVRMEPPASVSGPDGSDQIVSDGPGWRVTGVSANLAQIERILSK